MIYAEGFTASTGEFATLTGAKFDRVNKFSEAVAKKKAGIFMSTEGGKRRWRASQTIAAAIAFAAADTNGAIGGMSAGDVFITLDSYGELPFVLDDVFLPWPDTNKLYSKEEIEQREAPNPDNYLALVKDEAVRRTIYQERPQFWTDRASDLYVGFYFYGYRKETQAQEQYGPEPLYGSLARIMGKMLARSGDGETSVGQIYLFNVHDALSRIVKRARESGISFPALREHYGRPELTAAQA
ncbi:hypothetical protein WOC76_15515 [Methylocystis sp. IM3]|uniref:hypothetical protein n=1 Tax=unclassified Methylocystis TaxID=2625913 RepID=UPI0030F74311